MDSRMFVVPGKVSRSAVHVYNYNRRNDLENASGGSKKGTCLQPKPSVSTFLDLRVRYCFYQAPVTAFQRWYCDYQFASLFNDSVNGKLEWEYRIIFMDPTSSDKTGDESVEWACGLICCFYENNFLLQNHDKDRIRYSVHHDVTIAILGLRMQKGTNAVPSWRNNKNVKVISAITYRQGKGVECSSALITWLCVSQADDSTPMRIETWRRCGIGTFMIVPLIKICVIDGKKATSTVDLTRTSVKEEKEFHPMEHVELYLQCTQEFQMRFYESCGFVHINPITTEDANTYDGHFLLPKSLKESVLQGSDMGFTLNRHNQKSPNYCTPALYKLRGGEFKVRTKYANDVIDIVDSPMTKKNAWSKVPEPKIFTYCRYPPSRISQNTKSARLTDVDLESVFEKTIFVKGLLPFPLMKMLPPSSLCLRGEMTSVRRVEHSAVSFMSTGEMEMMLALLLSDGRYDDEVSIVPFSYLEAISEAAGVHSKFANACLQMEHMTNQRRNGRLPAIKKQFGKTVHDFEAVLDESHEQWNEYVEVRDAGNAYDTETDCLCASKRQALRFDALQEESAAKMTYIIQKVLLPNPSMLEKKLLVMPRCDGKHWSAVLIFNASFIKLAQARECNTKAGCLRPCFFRYCSIRPDGTRNVPTTNGVLWFLNLVFSYANHIKKDTPPTAGMEWLAPFGMDYLNPDFEPGDPKKLWGTPSFPSIRLSKDDIPKMPQQELDDGWNCGFGLVATIAIVMRDIIGSNDEARTLYCDAFQMATTETEACPLEENECVFYLPKGLLKPLPSAADLFWTPHGNYLSILRIEWFGVFDSLAELQNNAIPFRIDSRFKQGVEYITTKNNRKFPDWLDRGLKETAQVNLFYDSDAAAESMLTTMKESNVVSQMPETLHNIEKATGAEKLSNVAIMKATLPTVVDANAHDVAAAEPPTLNVAETTRGVASMATAEAIVPDVAETQMSVVATETAAAMPPDLDDSDDEDESIYQPQKAAAIKSALTKMRKETGTLVAPKKLRRVRKLPAANKAETKQTKATHKRKSKQTTAARKRKKNPMHNQKTPTMALNRETNEARKLRATVPWLKVPDDPTVFEPNTWTPNWKSFEKGDPRHFFGYASDDEPANNEDDNNMAKRRTIADYTQSQLTCKNFEAYHKKWQEYNDMGKSVIKPDAMEKYVDTCFETWNWSTSAQHKKNLAYFKGMKQINIEEAKKESEKEKLRLYYDDLMNAMAKERRYFRRRFENQYCLNDNKTVTGLRYNKRENKFVARVAYQRENPDKSYKKKGKTIIPKVSVNDEVEVTEDWVINQSGLADDVVQYILDLDVDKGFYPVPIDSDIKIHDKKIVRVKFVAESTRSILDVSAIATGDVASLPAKRKRGGEASITEQRRQPKKQEPRRRDVTVPEYFRIIYTDGNKLSTTEEFLQEHFSAKYLSEVKDCANQFVDIPVGDFKSSHLHRYPELRKVGAPTVRFVQDDNQDLCISNSLASVFYNLGFHSEATDIVSYGRREIAGGAVNALVKVSKYASSILPKWIQPKEKPLRFDWHDLVQEQRTVFVGVLFSSDGNSSHAVTIHGGFIYDANEMVALPLCQEALDYCTSTEAQPSTCIDFRRGYLFQYVGKKKKMIQRMTLPRNQCWS